MQGAYFEMPPGCQRRVGDQVVEKQPPENLWAKDDEGELEQNHRTFVNSER